MPGVPLRIKFGPSSILFDEEVTISVGDWKEEEETT